MHIQLSPEIRTLCPQFVGAALMADIHNTPECPALWTEIDTRCAELRERLTTESLKTMPAIEATRTMYRLCGKDPSRYRPSGEALVRRTLQGKPLYHVNTVVDLINLASMVHGYSIGGFDAHRIVGDALTLGIGRAGEPYEGIGRGPLNIEGLPVYRDAEGGIGTPTSDHERTKLHLGTTRLLALVNGYDGRAEAVRACADEMAALLTQYAEATNLHIHLY